MLTLSQTSSQSVGLWFQVRLLVSLTKPVAVAMIVIVTALGMGLAELIPFSTTSASPSSMSLLLTSLLIGLSAAGSFALNQYYERDLDRYMVRARARALPSGRLEPSIARNFGFSLFIFPLAGLLIWSTVTCTLLTALCGAMYVWVYTPLKRTSTLSTFAGAVPGALLPLMGWYAVRSDLSVTAIFFAAFLFLWQVPHALVIALRHLEDYRAAGMRQLPVVLGERVGRQHILYSSFMTALLSLAPVLWLKFGPVYAAGTLLNQGLTCVLALAAWRHTTPSSLTSFFRFHLISLPLQLAIFLLAL